ncbi:hypothetical protein Tco_0490238 [Tanacetum coccineum]
MEKLNVSNKVSCDASNESSMLNSVKANLLAAKVKNVDGTFLPRRYTTYQEFLKDKSSQNPSSCKVDAGIFGDNMVSSKETIKQPVKQVASSFASILPNKPMKKAVKIKELRSEEMVAGATVTLPFEVVEEVSSRFANTLYGYFIGKRLAFKLVKNYVMNTWAKYGLRRVQLHEDFFLFQFDTKEGMESVLENGPWLIRLVPLILNVWSPDTNLIKAEVKKAPVSSYARALIEVSAEKELIESIVVAIPLVKEVTSKSAMDSEGFIKVKKKKNKVQRVENKEKTSEKVQPKVNTSKVTNTNSFAVLNEVDDDGQKMQDGPVLNVSDSEVDEEIMMEDSNGTRTSKGASTPYVESHVMDSNLHRLCSLVFRHWGWSSNGAWCNKGTRIILGWNHNDVDVAVLTQDDQAIHTRVLKAEKKELFCYFVYAHNQYDQRHTLWKDTTAGGSSIYIAMREFKDCVADIEVLDVQKSGLMFTWNQKPRGNNGILKKIDRVMSNLEFNDSFAGAHAQVSGFLMFRVVKKLKLLKKPLQKLLYEKGNLYANVVRCRDELDSVQTLLDIDPYNTSLRAKEAACVVAFAFSTMLALLEVTTAINKQEPRLHGIKGTGGPPNSTNFHKAVKSRVSRSRIDAVTNMEGVLCENEQVPVAFVTHYEAFLGLVGETNGFVDDNLFKTRATWFRKKATSKFP